MKQEQYIYIDGDGSKFYYKDKSMNILHRLDGPAIEWCDGVKEWHVDNKRHRLDGPAIEYAGGGKSWYVDDKFLLEEEFDALTTTNKTTMNDTNIDPKPEDVHQQQTGEDCPSASDSQLREPLEAPRDGTFILGAFGWPWLLPAIWNSYDQEWVVCHMEAQKMANGVDDRWLEIEREKALTLTGWLPVPPLPGGYVFRPANAKCAGTDASEKTL